MKLIPFCSFGVCFEYIYIFIVTFMTGNSRSRMNIFISWSACILSFQNGFVIHCILDVFFFINIVWCRKTESERERSLMIITDELCVYIIKKKNGLFSTFNTFCRHTGSNTSRIVKEWYSIASRCVCCCYVYFYYVLEIERQRKMEME